MILQPLSDLIRDLPILKSAYDVPDGAKLALVEKRFIELEDRQQSIGGGSAQADGPAKIMDELVWIADYRMGSRFWELAIDGNGHIVRIRKSR